MMRADLDSDRETPTRSRLLAMIPIVAFVLLSAAMAVAYANDETWDCWSEITAVACAHGRSTWLLALVIWSVLALSLAAWLAAVPWLARRGRTFGISRLALLVIEVGVLVFGGLAVWVSQEASYARAPRGLDVSLWLGYVSVGLLFFGIAFVDGRPAEGSLDRVARVLSIVNGAIALIVGFAFTYTLLFTRIVY